MKYILISVMCLSIAACGSQQKEQQEGDTEVVVEQAPQEEQVAVITKIHTNTLKDMLNDTEAEYQLVDVRTPGEIEAGYIDGAMTGMDFTTGEFESKIDQLDKEKPVIIYCASGGRSNKAAHMLEAKGFKKVYDYTDGYSGWSADQ